MTDLERYYKESIISSYSDISFARLSNPGELIDRSFSLQDIFFPTRLSKPEEYKDYKFQTEGEYVEGINQKEVHEENERLIREILSLLDFDNVGATLIDDNSESDKKKDSSFPDSGHEKNAERDLYNDNKKYVIDISNDELADLILADIEEMLSGENQIIADRKYYAERKMILGKPGSGKSTYIRRLAIAYAYNENEFMKKNNWKENMFPVFIQFKTLSGVLKENPELSIMARNDFVGFLYKATCYELKNFEKTIEISDFSSLLEEKIKNNCLYVIVDSYDEISEEIRYEFTKDLGIFLRNNDSVNLLICSRIESIDLSNEKKGRVTEELCSIPNLKYQSVQDLNDSEITGFVEKWFDVVFCGEEKNKIKVERIVRSLLSHKLAYLDRIKGVPLYLSNLLCIARNTGEIPKSKDALLEKFVELCLNSSSNEENEFENLKKQLSYLAYKMTLEEKKIIRERELIVCLKECYNELDGSFNPEIPKDSIEHYIHKVLQLCNRGDVFRMCLTISGEDVYQFTHLQFQEYFTAYAINKLYCPNVTRRTLPIDLVEPHFKDRRWKEICLMVVSMEKQRWGAEEYVEKLVDLVKNEDDNYYYSNMLFDIVLNNTNMSRELRYNVYETLFGEHITDRQIKDICDGIDNDALSDEFLSYITERFEQSTEEEDIKFHFVCAVVKAKVSVNNGINPLRTAEDLLVSGKKDSERLLGLYMISVITWCQYNNINTSFSDCGCTDIHKIIMSLLDCLDSNNLLLVEAASVAMKDMCIAEHFEDSEDYWYTIVNKCCLEISDVRKQKFLRRIISVIPINYGTIVELQDSLKDVIGEVIQNDFDDGFDKEDPNNYVPGYVECVLMHRWYYSDDSLVQWMRTIQAKVLVQKGIDDEIKIRVRQIYRQVSNLTNPVSAGITEYESRHYRNAKNAFIFALSEGMDSRTNLGYMLRRREIDSLVISGHSYNAKELFKDGVDSADPTALMNMALLLCYKDNKYNYGTGLEFLKQYSSNSKLEITYSWWNEQAQKGEIEGYVVLLWLLDLNFIEEERMNYSRHDLLEYLNGYLEN